MRRRKRDAEQTREDLLAAALTVFRRNGIQRARLEDIAAEAGLTRGAIYWHFDGKDDIVRALLQRRIDPILSVIRDVTARPIPAVAQLETLIHDLLGHIEHTPHMRDSFLLEFEHTLFAPSTKEMHPLLIQSTQYIEKSLRSILERGRSEGTVRRDVPTDQLLSFLVSLIKGTLIDGRMRQPGPRGTIRSADPTILAALALRAIRV